LRTAKRYNFIRPSKRQLFIGISAVALVVTAVTILVIMLSRAGDRALRSSGEAEAVMTTKITVFDGLWDHDRHTDEFYYPTGIALMGEYLVVADYMCDRVQIIDGDSNRRIGMPGQYGLSYLDSGAFIDGYREHAMFMKPAGVSVNPDGTVLIADSGNHAIRRMDDEFVITIAGNGLAGFADGREGEAQFNTPRSAVMGPDGYIYVADTMNHCIRRIDSDSNVTLYAGVPGVSGYADGSIMEAMFFEPHGIYIDEGGVLYIADSANHAIRRIESGTVTTVAGMPGEINRLTGYPEGGYIDGNNTEARFNFPLGVALMPGDVNNPDGLQGSRILVADSMNHAIRLITEEGTRTLAGNGIADRFYASAENLRITGPSDVYTDGETLFIADTFNNRVLAVPLSERIMAGRPSRMSLLAETGITTDSRYAYGGDIRVFIGNERVDMGRVAPWNTAENIFVPIRPLFESLGAVVTVDESTDTLTISIQEYNTVLRLDRDYFILRGIAVTTISEIERLFPYAFEWYPEYSLIAMHIPMDLQN
jgi:DNA-binding beta-propeller fold protein YncE